MGVWTAAAGRTAWHSCKVREAPGQQDSSVRATPGLWQVRVFFWCKNHLLPIWLASPAVSREQRQESSAPTLHGSRAKSRRPPGPFCPWAASCPAPCHLPRRCHPAREGQGQALAAGIAHPAGRGPGLGFVEIMPEELQRSRLSHRRFNRCPEKVCEPRQAARLTVLWGAHRNSTHGF